MNALATAAFTGPWTPKGTATRSRIIAVAADLFFESGVSRTSVDDVCEASGVGKSQVYHYFRDKSSLVEAVVEEQGSRILAEQRPYLIGLSSWESWQRWRDSIVHRQELRDCIGGCPLGSIANEMVDVDGTTRAAVLASFDQWESAITDGIASMRELGLLRTEADPTALATVILAAVQGGLLLCKTRRSIAPLEASLDGALDLLRSYSA